MKQLCCPLNGWRNLSEFAYGGEVHDMPSPHTTSTRAWAEYVFFHDNPAGIVTEWWCHTPTAYWFLAERNTITNEVIRTFAPSERYAERVEFDILKVKSEQS